MAKLTKEEIKAAINPAISTFRTQVGEDIANPVVQVLTSILMSEEEGEGIDYFEHLLPETGGSAAAAVESAPKALSEGDISTIVNQITFHINALTNPKTTYNVVGNILIDLYPEDSLHSLINEVRDQIFAKVQYNQCVKEFDISETLSDDLHRLLYPHICKYLVGFGKKNPDKDFTTGDTLTKNTNKLLSNLLSGEEGAVTAALNNLNDAIPENELNKLVAGLMKASEPRLLGETKLNISNSIAKLREKGRSQYHPVIHHLEHLLISSPGGRSKNSKGGELQNSVFSTLAKLGDDEKKKKANEDAANRKICVTVDTQVKALISETATYEGVEASLKVLMHDSGMSAEGIKNTADAIFARKQLDRYLDLAPDAGGKYKNIPPRIQQHLLAGFGDWGTKNLKKNPIEVNFAVIINPQLDILLTPGNDDAAKQGALHALNPRLTAAALDEEYKRIKAEKDFKEYYKIDPVEEVITGLQAGDPLLTLLAASSGKNKLAAAEKVQLKLEHYYKTNSDSAVIDRLMLETSPVAILHLLKEGNSITESTCNLLEPKGVVNRFRRRLTKPANTEAEATALYDAINALADRNKTRKDGLTEMLVKREGLSSSLFQRSRNKKTVLELATERLREDIQVVQNADNRGTYRQTWNELGSYARRLERLAKRDETKARKTHNPVLLAEVEHELKVIKSCKRTLDQAEIYLNESDNEGELRATSESAVIRGAPILETQPEIRNEHGELIQEKADVMVFGDDGTLRKEHIELLVERFAGGAELTPPSATTSNVGDPRKATDMVHVRFGETGAANREEDKQDFFKYTVQPVIAVLTKTGDPTKNTLKSLAFYQRYKNVDDTTRMDVGIVWRETTVQDQPSKPVNVWVWPNGGLPRCVTLPSDLVMSNMIKSVNSMLDATQGYDGLDAQGQKIGHIKKIEVTVPPENRFPSEQHYNAYIIYLEFLKRQNLIDKYKADTIPPKGYARRKDYTQNCISYVPKEEELQALVKRHNKHLTMNENTRAYKLKPGKSNEYHSSDIVLTPPGEEGKIKKLQQTLTRRG